MPGPHVPNTIFEEELDKLPRSSTPAASLDTYETRRKPIKVNKKYAKWALYIVLGIIFYFTFGYITRGILWLLSLNPTIWAVYQAIEVEVAAKSLLGLFYAITFGSLFFMPNPMEAMTLYYLGNSSYFFVQILVTALAAYMIGMAANYILGWLVGTRFLKWLLKKKYDSFQRKMDRMGGFIIVVANMIPFFPTGPFTLFLGGVRHGFYTSMFYTALGRAIMLVIFYFGHQYFSTHLAGYMETFSFSTMFDSVRNSFG